MSRVVHFEIHAADPERLIACAESPPGGGLVARGPADRNVVGWMPHDTAAA